MKQKLFKALILPIMMLVLIWPQAMSAQAAGSQNAKVLASSLSVRSKPDAKSPVIGSLSRNTMVTVSQESYGWMKVQSGRTTGWVAGYYLQLLKGAPASQGSAKSAVTIASSKGLKGKLIVIDPGHGGGDHGTTGTKYRSSEKTLNLSTANYLADKLKQAGAQTIMTRTRDGDNPELSERAGLSQSKRADAFISIHYNSSPKPTSGTLTFFYSQSKDMPLARKIEEQLNKQLNLKSNGISFGNYHVLRNNSRPSALVELGFLSNAKDEAVVRTADYQRKAADAIVDGLHEYFD
ncbi:N-acetylmuramoyl-L-alanine amidase [Paenibacillus sp. NPDC056579]|uniref:N-acetylmuramoyl-L-alanine amidase n=1 Tax=Paenibacillus sp. NPDC056579 TaxID=3345871 RepID=UPI00369ACAFA